MLPMAKGNVMPAEWSLCILTAHAVACSCRKFGNADLHYSSFKTLPLTTATS
jgi:hypothetical protein